MSGIPPTKRFESQPDANRSQRLNLRSPAFGAASRRDVPGPWVQGVTPQDYTLTITRAMIPNGTLDERGVSVYATVGAGVAAVKKLVVARLPARGIVWHFAGETVRITYDVDAEVAGELLQDEVFAWLAPGRPSNTWMPDGFSVVPSAVPEFARKVWTQGRIVGAVPPTAPTDVTLQWLDIGGNQIEQTYLDQSVYFTGQETLVPTSAVRVRLANPGGDPSRILAQWECIS